MMYRAEGRIQQGMMLQDRGRRAQKVRTGLGRARMHGSEEQTCGGAIRAKQGTGTMN